MLTPPTDAFKWPSAINPQPVVSIRRLTDPSALEARFRRVALATSELKRRRARQLNWRGTLVITNYAPGKDGRGSVSTVTSVGF
jgi:hypothetical protein